MYFSDMFTTRLGKNICVDSRASKILEQVRWTHAFHTRQKVGRILQAHYAMSIYVVNKPRVYPGIYTCTSLNFLIFMLWPTNPKIECFFWTCLWRFFLFVLLGIKVKLQNYVSLMGAFLKLWPKCNGKHIRQVVLKLFVFKSNLIR